MHKRIAGGSIYGKLMLLVGLLVAAPLWVIWFYPEDARFASAFLFPSCFSVFAGLMVCLYSGRGETPATEWQSPMQRGSLPVLFAWCFAFLAGAAPFVTGGLLRFHLALFESVSGWTTTGLTVMDVTETPHIFLFHRAFMQYCGGLGFIIMIAMLVRGKQNMSLYSAEGHPDRIQPNLKKTARTIFILYSSFFSAGVLVYRFFGMAWFDSVCHTMSALSTAGFTTQEGSIGQYGSIPIEMVTVVLMLIGSSNFAVLLLLVKGRIVEVSRMSEVRFMVGMLLVFVPLAAFSLMRDFGLRAGDSFAKSLFGIVTTFTTTGYSTMNYALWPPFALGLLMILMIIGGSAGSTAGGIKLVRAYLLIRITIENIRERLSPAQRVSIPAYHRAQGKTHIDAALIHDTVGFVFSYMVVFVVGTLLLTMTARCGLFEAMYEFASAFGTVGISSGLTSPDLPGAALVVLLVGMVLGRLEIFIVFVGIYSGIHMLRRAAAP
ncbi:MAG: TrkH family potassium uptake protein [Clostridiales bacterium]|nr:TrkH family potassium uptake protein [Clostridiales bacterium]